MLHKIGALFPKKSKDGKDYLSGIMFQNKDEKTGFHLVAFKNESKAGNVYHTLNIAVDDDAGVLDTLHALRGEIDKAIEAEKNRQSDEIDVEDVEAF